MYKGTSPIDNQDTVYMHPPTLLTQSKFCIPALCLLCANTINFLVFPSLLDHSDKHIFLPSSKENIINLYFLLAATLTFSP